ncbi:MAG: carboxypeptidase regulatory-like domain-containing protein [Saprospiraceae bacterium]|nr:carboxypeptidase regulatory-like domain-containing protein [Saprospiraceae bacterium]
MNRAGILTLVIVIASMFRLGAQVTVQGVVTDSAKIPIPFATITAVFLDKKIIAAFAFTAENGHYKLNIPVSKSDSLLISASSIGFRKVEKSFVLEKEKSIYLLDFQLSTEKFNLPTLTIKADIPDKVVRKDTTTFKIKYYVDSTERVLEDVLKKLPGMNVKDDGSIEYKGKPIERILVEGDDVFNTNNKIPSKNLHADLIEEVQVIDRYSSNPLLKNIENSERQILNLTFKKDRKTAFFGSVNAGGGFTNRYEANTNLISFLGKTKIFALGGVNNVGNDLGNGGINQDKLINRYNNPDYYDPSVEAAILLPTPRLFAPNLSERRINVNQANLLSINFLTRPSEKWTIKAIGLFSKDRILQRQDNLTQYLLGNTQFSVKEIAQTTLKPSIANFHLENKIPLSKNANLTLVNEYKNELSSAIGTNILNEKNISQILNNHSIHWRNLLNLTLRVSDSTAVVVEGAYIRNYRPQELALIPKENYISLINQPNLNFTGLNQDANVATEYGGVVVRLVKAWRQSHKINLSFGGSIRYDSTTTAIFTENDNVKQLFNDSNYLNRVKFRTQDLFTTASYNIDINDLTIGGKLSLIQRHDLLTDVITDTNNFSKNWLYATPRLNVKWKWNAYNSISGTYAYNARFYDLDDVLGQYIFRDFRNLKRNIVTPYRINSHTFSSLYRFDYSAKKT